MSIANVKSEWVDGDLVFSDNSGTEIARFDSSSATFDVTTFALGGVAVTASAEALNGVSSRLKVANNTGGALSAGTLVYVSGYDATLGAPEVTAAGATARATHALTEDIADGSTGYADGEVVIGSLDTSGASAVGDLVYLAASGAFDYSALTGADQIAQVVGVVVAKSATVGQVLFFPAHAYLTALGTSGLQADAVTATKIADDAVSLEHLDAGITPGYVVRAATRHVWDEAAAAADVATLTGVEATDIIIATINVRGTNNPTSVLSAERSGDNAVTITLDQNGESGVTVISVVCLRAAA